MNKRTRQPGESFPFIKMPTAVVTRLSADAYYLYGFLLSFHDTVDGPLVDLCHDGRLRRSGLSERRLRRAREELIEAGLYTYLDERQLDGTVSRVQWVTEVPGALDAPAATRRPAPSARTAPTRTNGRDAAVLPVRRAEMHPADRNAARQRRNDTQGVLPVRPAETVPGNDVSAGQNRKDTQGVLPVRPAETVVGTDVSAGQNRNDILGVLPVRPAETHPSDDVSAGQDDSGTRARLPYKADRETDKGNPPPSPLDVPGPRRHQEEGISISIGDARAWLGRLPFRSRIRPGTSLGPVVAQFLSAPGAWPREVLMRELCADLDTAKNVEAVLHSRLKALNPVYDSAEYLTYAAQTNATVVQGERVPIDALKPAEDVRTAANDVFRQMRERERLRKAGAPEEESHGASGC